MHNIYYSLVPVYAFCVLGFNYSILVIDFWCMWWLLEKPLLFLSKAKLVNYALSPLMRRASWMSLGIMVTLLA